MSCSSPASEAVSRRPRDGSGNGSHRRKRPNSYVNSQVWKSIPQLQLLLFKENIFGKNTVLRDWPVSPRTHGNNSADLLWKALGSRSSAQPCSFTRLWMRAVLMSSGAVHVGDFNCTPDKIPAFLRMLLNIQQFAFPNS